MKTLWELMEEAYHNSGNDSFGTLEELLKNEDNSVQFMKTVLNDDTIEPADEHDDLYKIAKDRAKHSVITYLYGIILWQLYNDILKKRSFHEKYTERYLHEVWLLTSLNHDLGYFSKDLKKTDFDYNTFKYDLLTDEYKDEKLTGLNGFSLRYPECFAHTYQNIKDYDGYSRRFHRGEFNPDHAESPEKIDHGILGGYKAFNQMVRTIIKRDEIDASDLDKVKLTCMTIAQHNIFKSYDSVSDQNYPKELSYLYHDQGFEINAEKPFLLFLSLIDTIECVKKLGASENDGRYLRIRTVLQSIQLSYENEDLVLDFSFLRKRVEDKKDESLMKAFNSHLNGVATLDTWTSFKTVRNEDTISIKVESDSE